MISHSKTNYKNNITLYIDITYEPQPVSIVTELFTVNLFTNHDKPITKLI